MANGVDPQEPMALVSVAYGDILLNTDDACAVFKILCKAQIVEYDYTDKSYKAKSLGGSGNATLKAFSVADYAAMSLKAQD